MSGKQYYLGLDQGTTGTTALLLDEHWQQVSCGYREISQSYPQAGWVEHDPDEIYRSLLDTTRQALNAAQATAKDIRCLGLANQGETMVFWDLKTGEPICPAIVWQDRRTAFEVDQINAQYGDLFYTRTGLKLDAYFGASKIRWVLRNVPRAKELLNKRRLAAGALDSWMIWKLTGGKEFVTDYVTAGRTCLMNIHSLIWDQDLLEVLGIPPEILPEIRENAGSLGRTAPDSFLGAAVPITGSIVDQQAALLGQGCCKPGNTKTTYGTGCFMLMNIGEQAKQVKEGILTTLAWVRGDKPTFALDGGIYIAGAALRWLRDGLGIIQTAAHADALALSVENNGGMYFVPAFTGLAAPYWDSHARGTIVGITAGVTAAHLVRAALEATAYQVNDIFGLIESSTGMHVSVMRADGGSTSSQFLMQFQADLLGIPVEIPVISETTALGAAYLAAMGIGDFIDLEETARLWKCRICYEPRMHADARSDAMGQWRRAVERSREWALTPS